VYLIPQNPNQKNHLPKPNVHLEYFVLWFHTHFYAIKKKFLRVNPQKQKNLRLEDFFSLFKIWSSRSVCSFWGNQDLWTFWTKEVFRSQSADGERTMVIDDGDRRTVAQLSRLWRHVRRIFRRARVGDCRWVPENYALPGKRGRASGPTIRLRNWYRARKAAAFARNTRGSDSFSAARNGRAERWSVARCRGESGMQYGRKLARTASQARLFDRISLGGVAGGTIDFYMPLYSRSHELPVDFREARDNINWLFVW